MGEIADLYIKGVLCNLCGTLLECKDTNVPTLCHDCHSNHAEQCDQPYRGMYCENFYETKTDSR